MKYLVALAAAAAMACSRPAPDAAPAAETQTPKDAQHAGITTPHGDHSPHHGGMVLMSGELHYEVVLDPNGRHSLWFSDAVREELPASVASKVSMVVTRPGAADETLALAIDDSGESWVASGRPLSGDDVMVKLAFVARGEPFEIEIPYVRQERQQAQ
jgi:hypothetical protein